MNSSCRTPAGWILMLILSALLFGCASNDNIVEPTPLKPVDRVVQLHKLWSKRIGHGFEAETIVLRPAISDEQIYVADARGMVIALNRSNGREVWKQKLNQAVVGGVSVDEDMLWVTTRRAQLIALDAQTGARRWDVTLSSESLAPVTVRGRHVIVQTQDAHLTCFDRETGQRLWVLDTTIPVLTLRGAAMPRIEGDAVFAGFANGKLASVDLKTGVLQWERQIGVVQGASELDRLVDIDGDFLV
ncbi:MAG: PQQ-binding-like beta-propeller repeat protein, partial [Gammaproteobacteria bacterium]